MVGEEARVNVESQSEAGGQEQSGRSADVGPGRTLWFKALVGIVASPRTSFEIIRERQPWVGALAVILAVLALRTLLT